MWSTHCATIAQLSSSRRAQSWFSGRDKTTLNICPIVHRTRVPATCRACHRACAAVQAFLALRCFASLAVVGAIFVGRDIVAVRPCAEVRRFLRHIIAAPSLPDTGIPLPRTAFYFVIVLALFAGGGCVYPLYRLHIHSTQKAPLRKPSFNDISIAHKSCCIVLTLWGDAIYKPLHAVSF